MKVRLQAASVVAVFDLDQEIEDLRCRCVLRVYLTVDLGLLYVDRIDVIAVAVL